jgi:hypothetical protein
MVFAQRKEVGIQLKRHTSLVIARDCAFSNTYHVVSLFIHFVLIRRRLETACSHCSLTFRITLKRSGFYVSIVALSLVSNRGCVEQKQNYRGSCRSFSLVYPETPMTCSKRNEVATRVKHLPKRQHLLSKTSVKNINICPSVGLIACGG